MAIKTADSLVFQNQHFVGEDFSNRKIIEFSAINSRFENCRFEGMSIKNVCFGEGKTVSEYTTCSFDGSSFSSNSIGLAKFNSCSFRKIEIKKLFSFAGEFINCEFSGTMKKAVFYATIPMLYRSIVSRKENDFYGNNFSKLKMFDVAFRAGIDLSKQILPISDEYLYLDNPRPILLEAKKIILSWDGGELKKNAEVILKIKEELLDEGQKQLFIVKDDIDPAIFDLLKEISVKMVE